MKADLPDAVRRADDALVTALGALSFAAPVTHVYNPLVYARANHDAYWARYGTGPKRVLVLGMNPGPWGMAQTGVPFGEVATVRDWLDLQAPIGKPPVEHPKRPVLGLACPRGEVSGRRLWGAIRDHYGAPAAFFANAMVVNYCPLSFMEASGKNRTPDQLPAAERQPLYLACDAHLRALAEILQPEWLVGVGGFAADRAATALAGRAVKIGRISHPSPANPAANRGWAPLVTAELANQGICQEGAR